MPNNESHCSAKTIARKGTFGMNIEDEICMLDEKVVML